MRVIVVGAGGHGQVVQDALLRAADAGEHVTPLGFVDDDEARVGQTLAGGVVLARTCELAMIPHDAVIVAVGDNRTRRRLAMELAYRGERFWIARHPAAVVAPDVALGSGVMISAGAIVNTGSSIGAHAILNTGCTVDHHNVVGDHAHIAPGVHLGGGVRVGDGVLVGIGAVVLPNTQIGAWAVVGAGAVVTRDVAPGACVVGVPARPVASRAREVA